MIGTIKISQLPISSPLDGSENLIINQVGVTKLTTVDDVVGLVTYFASDVTPQPLGTAAIGVSADYAREDHVHAMPTAADVGADPAGTASSAISTHEAAADPHPGYALESDLGGAALLDVGTTAGTVAAGDDGRFTTDLDYTASTRVLTSSTGADVTLPLFTSTDAGLTPLSGGGTTNFLRADGTWAAPATGGTPGGTTGQIQWNSAGSFAGVSGSTVGATGDITLSLNGTASTPPFRLTGTWFTGGTTTTTKPHVLIEPAGTTSTAWSTSGTGLGINAPSEFTGNLLDLQVNGTSFLRFTSAGELIGRSSSGRIAFEPTGTRFIDWVNFNNVFRAGGALNTIVRSDGGYGFSSSATVTGSIDTALKRDKAGILIPSDGSTGVGYFKSPPVTVSALPAAATVGAGTRGFVSDSTVAASGNFGAIVTGGGSNNVPVFSDGTNWRIG